jgi:hypothetical protein
MSQRQLPFIFIAPQDLSRLTPDPQLKILKLTPLTRHTIVSGPSQQMLVFALQQASDYKLLSTVSSVDVVLRRPDVPLIRDSLVEKERKRSLGCEYI